MNKLKQGSDCVIINKSVDYMEYCLLLCKEAGCGYKRHQLFSIWEGGASQ